VCQEVDGVSGYSSIHENVVFSNEVLREDVRITETTPLKQALELSPHRRGGWVAILPDEVRNEARNIRASLEKRFRGRSGLTPK